MAASESSNDNVGPAANCRGAPPERSSSKGRPQPGFSPLALPVVSWLTAASFLYAFGANAGFPPPQKLQTADLIYGGGALLFLFLPFFSKLKVGALLELEREVEKTREDVRQFKNDVGNSIALLTNTFSSVSALNSHVVIHNTPTESQLRSAAQEVAHQSTQPSKVPDIVFREILEQSDFDTTLALARTRIDIERLLRTLLDHSTSLSTENTRYASVRKLFDAFVAEKPNLRFLVKPFAYVTQVCNAAIHAQTVSEEKAREALELGAQIISVLQDELTLKQRSGTAPQTE